MQLFNRGLRYRDGEGTKTGYLRRGISVLDLVGLRGPCTESCKRFITHDLDRGDTAMQVRFLQFVVQESIVKSDFSSILGGIGEINPRKVSPIDCAETHGTGFAGGIELAILQVKYAQIRAGLPDGEHLRMSGRIIGRSDSIHALGDDLAVSYDYRPKRPASSRIDTVDGELNGSCHEGVAHFLSSPSRLLALCTPDGLITADTFAETAEQVYAELLAVAAVLSCGIIDQGELKKSA